MTDCGCGLAESPYKIFLKKAIFFAKYLDISKKTIIFVVEKETKIRTIF